MIYIVENEPQFIVDRDMVIYVGDQPIYLDEGEPIGFNKTEDGRLLWGEADEDSGNDIVEFNTKTIVNDLLEACQLATFHPSLDEEGDSFIKPVLLEGKSTLTEKISTIPLTESVPDTTILVSKIRYE